jgi:hypothetical protein
MSAGSEEKEARIAQVYDAQTCSTAAAIGLRLGKTRNTIIGWYTRNPGLRMRYPLSGQRFGAAKGKSMERTTPKPGFVAEARKARVAAKKKITAAKAEVEQTPLPREPEAIGAYTLMTLPANGCKWPSGENPIMFCGEPRGDDKAYCAYHKRLSITEWVSRRLRPPRTTLGGWPSSPRSAPEL